MAEMGRRKMHSEFRLEYLKKRAHLKKPMRKFEDNIKMTLKEIIWNSGNWMYVTQNRDKWLAVVDTAMNLRIP